MRPKILYPLFGPLTSIKGIGPKNASLLEYLCGNYIVNLLTHSPASYIDRRNNPKIKDLKEDSIVTLTITAGTQKAVLKRIAEAMAATGSMKEPFVVIADADNSVFIHSSITDVETTLSA